MFVPASKYWPVSAELMAQYRDGSHTHAFKGNLIWQNQNGQRHRDGDLPAFIGGDDYLEWRQNDKLHRSGDKPAIIYPDGDLYWYQNDKRHRYSGPAVIYPDGTHQWWVNDEEITHEVKAWLNRKRWRGTSEQIVEFKLRFT